jgi:hypothetical protein
VNDGTKDCDGDGVKNSDDCAPLNKDIYPGAPCDDGNIATVSDKYDSTCKCVGLTSSGAIDESFSSQTNNVDISLPGWLNVAVKGPENGKPNFLAATCMLRPQHSMIQHLRWRPG